jgi:hypothetical protein
VSEGAEADQTPVAQRDRSEAIVISVLERIRVGGPRDHSRQGLLFSPDWSLEGTTITEAAVSL